MFTQKLDTNVESYKEREIKHLDRKILKGLIIRRFREDDESDEEENEVPPLHKAEQSPSKDYGHLGFDDEPLDTLDSN